MPEWLEIGVTAALAAVATPLALRAVYHAWPLRALPAENGFDHLMRVYFNWANAVTATGFLWASVFRSGALVDEPFVLTVLAFGWALLMSSVSAWDHRRAAGIPDNRSTAQTQS